jgi:hypothetical protein
MSTLTVSNVSDGTLSIPTTYVTNGSAKAWVNFNGTGTIAARDSLNVSSITDSGTGRTLISYSSNMNNADYAVVVGGNSTNITSRDSSVTPLAGSMQVVTFITNTLAATDSAYVDASMLGDLA